MSCHPKLKSLSTIALVASAVYFRCSNPEPVPPTGIAVWADDCSEIACAINRQLFDSGLFMNHPTEQQYDIALYDDKGNKVQTILSGRKVDGYESSVEEIYYMKTKGYLLVKTLMYNSGGTVYEKIALDGTATRLFHRSGDAYADDVVMAPSPAGTFIAMAYRTGNGPQAQCKVTLFDATGTDRVDSTETFTVSYTTLLRWESDSVLEVHSSGTTKIIDMSMKVRDSTGAHCTLPATSSSAFCENKGFATFNGTSEVVEFVDTPPSYHNWCR